MSCSQHPAVALDPVGSYKLLIFTLLSINFSRNICTREVDHAHVSRVQTVMIW